MSSFTLSGAAEMYDGGEYDRELDGENEETWSNMANSSVEFVNLTILERNSWATAWLVP